MGILVHPVWVAVLSAAQSVSHSLHCVVRAWFLKRVLCILCVAAYVNVGAGADMIRQNTVYIQACLVSSWSTLNRRRVACNRKCLYFCLMLLKQVDHPLGCCCNSLSIRIDHAHRRSGVSATQGPRCLRSTSTSRRRYWHLLAWCRWLKLLCYFLKWRTEKVVPVEGGTIPTTCMPKALRRCFSKTWGIAG